MAPLVQNTFSVIPDLPSLLNTRDNGGNSTAGLSRPPMTTKQVKKAYLKANKGPKLSKAERRRQELFEQDRIRKEFEKERNLARARAARDKKKEKVALERAERKSKGLPLVDVRPSQGTIASFVRPKKKNTRKVVKTASPVGVDTDDEENEEESPCLSPPKTGLDHSGGSNASPSVENEKNESVEESPSLYLQNSLKGLTEPSASPVLVSHGGDGACQSSSVQNDPKVSGGKSASSSVAVLGGGSKGEPSRLLSQSGRKPSYEKKTIISPSVASQCPAELSSLSPLNGRKQPLEKSASPSVDSPFKGEPVRLPLQSGREGSNENKASQPTVSQDHGYKGDPPRLPSQSTSRKLSQKAKEQKAKALPSTAGQDDGNKRKPLGLVLQNDHRRNSNLKSASPPVANQTKGPQLSSQNGCKRSYEESASKLVTSQCSGNKRVNSPCSKMPNSPKHGYEIYFFDDSNKENIPPYSADNSQGSRPSQVLPVIRSSQPLVYNRPLAGHTESSNKRRRLNVAAKPRIPEDAYASQKALESEKPDMKSRLNVDDIFLDIDFSDDDLSNDLSSLTTRRHKSPSPPSNSTTSKQKQDTGTFGTMPPPALPPPKILAKPKAFREAQLPPSTQSFFLSHLDDFFPSPSQEVREIFEEPKRKAGPNLRKAALAGIRKTTTPSTGRNEHPPLPPMPSLPNPPKPPVLPPIEKTPPPKEPDPFEMPFFSTQDFFLSSQDVKDIEESPLPPPRAPAPSPAPVLPRIPSLNPQNPPRRSPKRFFTTSSSEPDYSKIPAWEGPKAQKQAAPVQAGGDEKRIRPSDEKDVVEETRGAGSSAPKTTTQIKERSASRPSSIPKPSRPAQRNPRVKSSYEAMLELLAKGKQNAPVKSRDEVNKTKPKARVHGNETPSKTPMMPPSSQETDYDCGEEWDDDDFFPGLL